jgi:ferredoxin
MKTDLFYYSGTGNALWAARTLAERLGDAEVYPLSRVAADADRDEAEAIGLIFPVHVWGLPRRVIEFVRSLPKAPSRYTFAVAVNAGQVAATLLQLERLMRAEGLSLSSGFGIVMPSNYIPWGGPGPKEGQMKRIAAAREKIGTIAAAVAGRARGPIEKGPLWQNVLLSGINRLGFSRIPEVDKGFWVDEKCNACGVCRQVCPCANVTLQEGRPVWLHHCEQCLACIQWCPQEAIQFGKKTPRYERYHHPEVRLQDMIAAPKRGEE